MLHKISPQSGYSRSLSCKGKGSFLFILNMSMNKYKG